ncbi:MAG TPA: hypothetical protein GXZ82_05695 [Firmicutes bacterium]|jgi:uncharacterized protein YqgV (UPF0045/DUF77 family)|nr:hypothetical protein [Bacillota bacterium]
MILAQVSLYPIEAADADAVINASIAELDGEDIQYSVGPVSTHIQGDPTEVFAALQTLFERATAAGGEVSMVVTITNAEV